MARTHLPHLPYRVREIIADNGKSLVYRVSLDDGRPAVLKTHAEAYAQASWLACLRHEHQVLQSLSESSSQSSGGLAGVSGLVVYGGDDRIQYGILQEGSRYGLLTEDHGAVNVGAVMDQRRLSIAESVDIALSVARTLAAIHERRIIHRDINPSNVIYNRDTGYVGVVDFGLASLLPRQQAVPVAADGRGLVGTLAYLAPEQSGRMNRSTDHRADLYALGATLYEMLVGTPPFVHDDARRHLPR